MVQELPLCFCKKCNEYLIDNDPYKGQSTYEVDGFKETIYIRIDGEQIWACPTCKDNIYLEKLQKQ